MRVYNFSNELKWYKNLSLVVSITTLVCLAISILLPGYLNYNPNEALSINEVNGWCNIPGQSIGTHCFGDFYYPLKFANLDNPWNSSANPYPPVSMFMLKPFAILVTNFPNSAIPLIIYLLFCLTCLIVSVYFLCRRAGINQRFAALVCAGTFVSGPFLMALDRGNVQMAMVPLYLFFCIGILENKTRWAFLSGFFLVLLKPQLILLGIIFLANREWKKGIIWLFGNLTLFSLSFLLYPENIGRNLFSYIYQVQSYQNYTNAGSPNPANISIANSWSIIGRIISRISPELLNKDPIGEWNYYSNLVTIILLIIICGNMYLFGFKRSKFINLLIVLLVPLLIPNVTFSYYLCALIPVIVLHFINKYKQLKSNENKIHKANSNFDFQSSKIRLFFSLSIFFLFIPWSIPWKIIPIFRNQSWADVGLNWIPGQFSIIILFFLLILEGTDVKFKNIFKRL